MAFKFLLVSTTRVLITTSSLVGGGGAQASLTVTTWTGLLPAVPPPGDAALNSVLMAWFWMSWMDGRCCWLTAAGSESAVPDSLISLLGVLSPESKNIWVHLVCFRSWRGTHHVEKVYIIVKEDTIWWHRPSTNYFQKNVWEPLRARDGTDVIRVKVHVEKRII